MPKEDISPEISPAAGLQERREILLETTLDCLEKDDLNTLRLFLNDLHPADLAELFRQFDEEEQQRALQVLAESVGLAMLGAIVPLVFRTLGVDPAVASGLLITTLNDALSLGIYFSISAILLGLPS